MKKVLLTIFVLAVCLGVAFAAPRPKIVNQAVNPEMLKTIPALVPDSTVATGLDVVAAKTYVYLSVFNFGDTAAITSQTWTMQSKPTGSAATLVSIPSLGWQKFLADSVGTYVVKVSITASTGTKDTTINIHAANFVGVGNFFNVPGTFPKCMTCHGSMPAFTDIFNRWKVSGHANIFRYEIDSGAAYYSTACMKCHTTGYDHNRYAVNGGFDDVARQLGWVWTAPPAPGKWNNLVTNFPNLVNVATIGCENCHGAGSLHAMSGDTTKIQISYNANVCGPCHGEPWRHGKIQQWEYSKHAEAIFEGRTVADSLRNNLNDCNRCHDGEAYIGFTKNRKSPLNLNVADQEMISCQTCHDPHGNNYEYQLRRRPGNSDTLANGVSFASTGDAGRLCMSCHMSRRNNATYVTVRGSFTSTWGPHGSTQGDVLMGSNAATFGFPYVSGSHKNISGACAGCHMAATTDTGTVTRDKVGGHTMNLHYAPTNYDHTTGCTGCHPGITSFNQFIAPQDFDGNGQIQDWQTEVAGCLKNLRIALPPVGVDSVSWGLIARDSMNLNLRKSYWNYLMITNDGSLGMHNPFYVIQVLLVSKNYAVGIQQTSTEIPAKFDMSQNYPNPFNPITKINYDIPTTGFVTLKIFDMTGREVKNLVSTSLTPGKYTVDWNSQDNNGKVVSSGVYFYRITQGSNVITKKMVLIK